MTTSEAAPRARGEYAKSAQRRKDIVAAAVEVFSESGFRDGSLRTVAERAGMTHAGMRHHFPTKVDLLEAVLQWREEESVQRARMTHPVGADVIRAWIDSVGHNVAQPALVELEMVLSAEAISSDNPAHAYFNDLYRRAEQLLERAFAHMASRGELRTEIDPGVAARLLFATTLGLQTLWLRNRSIDIESELRLYTQAMLTIEL
ncbi:TetR/AcrR family transcriptional regulator [Microbacterium hominis]|uniref:TetR/AcrR family transcriptional regulator n=1 Tax=Microbacterium hominis TaxID=162426 RepID=A0A7D4PU05_9MICO|nr:TetR/AcrR family transcriptional regulator [Microbacterium hominis]QKJ18914.1 TetR/AcrR family transcriptional regulator [Microbacterium hominis]